MNKKPAASKRRGMNVKTILVLCVAALLASPTNGGAQTTGSPGTTSAVSGTRFELERLLKPVDDSLGKVNTEITDLDSGITALVSVISRVRSAQKPALDTLVLALNRAETIGADGNHERSARLLASIRTAAFGPIYEVLQSDDNLASEAVSAAEGIIELRSVAPFDLIEVSGTILTGRRSALVRPLVQKDFGALAEVLSQAAFDRKRTAVVDTLEAYRKRFEGERATKVELSKALTQRAGAIVSKIAQKEAGQTQIDLKLITWAMPLFAATFLLLLVLPRVYNNPVVDRAVFESPILLELITVFLLVATVLMLGLGGKLTGEVLGTLLGGISGYVLGRGRDKAISSRTAMNNRADGARNATQSHLTDLTSEKRGSPQSEQPAADQQE